MRDNCWQNDTDTVTLAYSEVHVWRCYVHQSLPWLPILKPLLRDDEFDRAGRFFFQQDRERFIIARSFLRTILGKYLQQPPAKLLFAHSETGKPRLAGGEDLRFNLAHSRDLVLLALNWGRPLGVDVEYMRPDLETMAIAHRFFSAAEIEALESVPSQVQTQAFYRTWARKEAFLKATGDGLSFPLNQFSVSLDPLIAGVVKFASNSVDNGQNWSLQHLAPHPDYAAALAVSRTEWHLVCHHWSGPVIAKGE